MQLSTTRHYYYLVRWFLQGENPIYDYEGRTYVLVYIWSGITDSRLQFSTVYTGSNIR